MPGTHLSTQFSVMFVSIPMVPVILLLLSQATVMAAPTGMSTNSTNSTGSISCSENGTARCCQTVSEINEQRAVCLPTPERIHHKLGVLIVRSA